MDTITQPFCNYLLVMMKTVALGISMSVIDSKIHLIVAGGSL